MKPDRIILPLCLSFAWLSPAAESPKPNVLFIVVDDLNDWGGPWGGHPQVKTPNLDRLAKRGVVFTQAYCAAPLCNPSRSAMFSGRHPFETVIFDNNDAGLRKLHPELVLLPDHFRSAGYRTVGSGKLLHQKVTGWQRATRVPLLIVPPANTTRGFASGVNCIAPVSLRDVKK